jgi:capsular polysaccharide biosynthesis protein
VTDRDQTSIFSLNGDNGESAPLGAYDDLAATENRSADSVPGLVSLGFIKGAIRRSAGLLLVMAVAGLVAGLGVYRASPHPYQASASVLVTLSPYEDFLTAAANDQAIAETRSVATLAVQELGLPQQSVGSFLSTYSVASVTDQLLTVTASAPSSAEAILRAGAVANAFLKFRAAELRAQHNLNLGSLDQQISQVKQRADSIAAQISQLQSLPNSSAQLSQLRAEQTGEAQALNGLQQAINFDNTTTVPELTTALKGSVVLSVAPVSSSKKKALLRYGAVGLIAGLVLGLGLVVVRALVSDRLRQRYDVAYVLDAPVRLSVGRLRARRWPPSLPGRAAKRDLAVRRVIAYLHRAVPRNTGGAPGLAIVAVDNASVVARVVAAFATFQASQGNHVVVADLSRDARLARLLGAKAPGVRAVNHNGTNFTIVVPDSDDAAPLGPLRAVISPVGPAQADGPVAASYASADLLLTLVTLDPAVGGDHLATWATSAVVVVSAGQSSAERIHGVGEMIRLAGTRLDSVVLIGADKRDESLGLAPRPDEQAGIGFLSR